MPCLTGLAKPGGMPKSREAGPYRPIVSAAHSKSTAVSDALAALDAGRTPEPALLRDASRALLAELARRAPGRSIEVRVPPYGAVQCGDGPRHTRGTPPNVVEMDPLTWLQLATGRLGWTEAVADGRIHASGNRADISRYVPI
jgi:hypothetical protein